MKPSAASAALSTPAAEAITVTPLSIPARDGLPLGASLYTAAGTARGLVLVVPATGVVRRLYDRFARHLAASGFDVLTWDWRGTGDSRPASLRGFHATMLEWAHLDLAAVAAWAREHAAGKPLLAVGHSYGGQALGLVPAAGLAGAVTVAAQSGWWGHWPRPQRYRLAFFWYLVMPLVTRLFGYFPSGRFGLGEDLPAGVALEWARWCRSPDYLGDWSGHRRLAIPLLSVGFDDDTFAPPEAVDALHRRYSAAQGERRQLSPAAAGVRRIGHFGFFKPGLPALWDELAAWLHRVAARPTPP
jgi:predicted alpha/beta hydrolase